MKGVAVCGCICVWIVGTFPEMYACARSRACVRVCIRVHVHVHQLCRRSPVGTKLNFERFANSAPSRTKRISFMGRFRWQVRSSENQGRIITNRVVRLARNRDAGKGEWVTG